MIPEAVGATDSGHLTLNNDPILLSLINAVKELKSRTEMQERRIEELQNLLKSSGVTATSGLL